MKRKVPDFIIVGAAKCGTTIVWEWLSEHTGIFMPEVKEPHYFCFADHPVPCAGGELDPFYRDSLIIDAEHYHALWRGARKDQLCGEASPGYLYYPEAAQRIIAANSGCKVIALLRNPPSRAFSQYMHHVRDGYEPNDSFEDALAAEPERINKGWWWGYHYRTAGLYAAQWRRYCDIFRDRQRLLLLYDDLVADPAGSYRTICAFLDLAPQNPDLTRHVNQTADLTRVPVADALTRTLRHGNAITHAARRLLSGGRCREIKKLILTLHSRPVPKFRPDTRRELAAFYRSDVEALAKLTGRDLSAWLA